MGWKISKKIGKGRFFTIFKKIKLILTSLIHQH